jgi:hypothetical protein
MEYGSWRFWCNPRNFIGGLLLFRQLRSCLKPNGRILIAEPKFHVSLKRFQEILVSAKESGLNLCETPYIRFSRSVVVKI